MPDITTTTFTDGNTIVADDVTSNLYNPNTGTNTSFEVINGRLDSANREAGWNVDRPHIQHGALSGGKAVGGTLNLDYFPEAFGDYNTTTPSSAVGLLHAIPGASIEFYLPYDTPLVLFSWSITYRASGFSTVHCADLKFYIDGAPVSAIVRTTVPGLVDATMLRGTPSRSWLGHHRATALTRGWHSASLRIGVHTGEDASDGVRVRCRHLDYVYFS